MLMIKSCFEKSVDTNMPLALTNFCNCLDECLNVFDLREYSDISIVCIGTDRSTGDCLGPLTGYKLSHMHFDKIHVFGTLDSPVHAKNLPEYISKIERFENPFTIAVDACLGRTERIGCINIKEGHLNPGSGVNKTLPSIGNVSITGIVNVGGFMEIMVLQNTRLSLVMNMANIISSGIRYNMWKIQKSSSLSQLKHDSKVLQFNEHHLNNI